MNHAHPPRLAEPQRRRLLPLLALLALALSFASTIRSDEPAAAATVHLSIDYGDGVQKQFTTLPWRAEMTVLDVLTEASKHPRGIRFEHRGKGETAFVTQIDDVKNEGQGRNWLFQINDKPGAVSSGVQRVAKHDRILWKFATYR